MIRFVLVLSLVFLAVGVGAGEGSTTVGVVRLTLKGDGLNKAYLSQLCRKVEKISGVKLVLKGDLAIPQDYLESSRKQYDGGRLAQLVSSRYPSAPCIGIAEVDLFLPSKPDWRYCFSAYLGKAAVFSDYRMRPENYGQKAQAPLALERLEKMVLSWVGRGVLGKPASTDSESLLYQPVLGPDDLDRMKWEF